MRLTITKNKNSSSFYVIKSVTINGKSGYNIAADGKFSVLVEGVGRFDVGNYTVTVEGRKSDNYADIPPNTEAKLQVTPTTVLRP